MGEGLDLFSSLMLGQRSMNASVCLCVFTGPRHGDVTVLTLTHLGIVSTQADMFLCVHLRSKVCVVKVSVCELVCDKASRFERVKKL